MTIRAKLALSYLGLVVMTGAILFVITAAVLRFVPHGNLVIADNGSFVPNRSDLTRAYVPRALGALAIACAVGGVVGWLIAGRAVRRLQRITAVATLVSHGSLHHRVELSGPDDEVRRLAATFDGMVARLECQVEAERQFAANAAHQLRTPQAVTRSLLEVALAEPGEVDVDVLIRRLTEVNDRSIALTEALLTFSRAELTLPGNESVDLTLLVDEALDTAAITTDRIVEVQTDLRDAVVSGESLMLGQLVDNLVHNAFRHNRPRGGWVLVRTGHDDAGAVVLRVENPGADLTPDVVATLVEPFERGLAGRDGGGAGLGLAVAAAVARGHGGRLILTARRGGGLIVEAMFPPAVATPRPGATSAGSVGTRTS